MAAGDLNWTDGGRTSRAQFFYGHRKGRKQVGKCGKFETRIALYAQRLSGRWKRLFRMKFDREPSGEELWAVLRTGEIAENVRVWEKQPLREEKNPPTQPHIHWGSAGRRMTAIMAEWLAERQVIKEEAIKAKLEEEEILRIKQAEARRKTAICISSEIPRHTLKRIVDCKIEIGDVCAVFGVDDQRIEVLIEAFGLNKD